MNSIDAFHTAVKAAKLKYFTTDELLYMGASHYDRESKAFGKNTLPPPELWGNIISIAKVADEIRERLGAPIVINSVYRSPAYNRAVGGEKRSFHMKGCAMDITTRNLKQLFKIAKEVRNEQIFSGGIGLYRTFCHIDNRGYNADWDMR